MKNFKFLEHTADIKFQAFGKTKEGAFRNSFFALRESICGGLKIQKKIRKKIKIKAKDDESLLYNFLEEFLYLLDSENFLISEIRNIKIINGNLSAEVFGDESKNYDFTNNVKAITYNQMFVKKENEKWVVQVVLDV
ncbi:MAG: archease [Candidatus Pacearchaeota archaeon]|jgi:SHS2 domain-containing protein